MKYKLTRIQSFQGVDPAAIKAYAGRRFGDEDLVLKISERLTIQTIDSWLYVALSRGIEARVVPGKHLHKTLIELYRRTPVK